MDSSPPEPNAALLALRLEAGEEPDNAGLMLGRPPVESPPLPPVKLPPAPWSDTRKQEAVQKALSEATTPSRLTSTPLRRWVKTTA